MLYKVFGYLHAQAHWRVQEIRRLAGEKGQGTVEYVGLILLVSLLMVGMVAAMKGFNRNLSKGGYYRNPGTESERPAIDFATQVQPHRRGRFLTGSVSGTRETANWSPAR